MDGGSERRRKSARSLVDSPPPRDDFATSLFVCGLSDSAKSSSLGDGRLAEDFVERKPPIPGVRVVPGRRKSASVAAGSAGLDPLRRRLRNLRPKLCFECGGDGGRGTSCVDHGGSEDKRSAGTGDEHAAWRPTPERSHTHPSRTPSAQTASVFRSQCTRRLLLHPRRRGPSSPPPRAA